MQALITQLQSDDHHTGSAHVLMLEASAPGKSASVCMARWRRSCTAVAKRSAWGLLPSSARRRNSPRLLQSSHARFIPPCAAEQSSSGGAIRGALSARRAPNTLQHDSALGRAGMRWLHASLARFQGVYDSTGSGTASFAHTCRQRQAGPATACIEPMAGAWALRRGQSRLVEPVPLAQIPLR